MAQRVCPDPLPRRDRAKFLSAFHRCLHPAPCGRGVGLDDSALADIAVCQGAVLCFGVTPRGACVVGRLRWSGRWLWPDSYANVFVQDMLRYIVAKLR